MAEGTRFICRTCRYSVESWSDGNPYLLDERGQKQYAYHPDHERLEAVARSWNQDPTPFEWGGRRQQRRDRARIRRHQAGGSGGCTRRRIRRGLRPLDQYLRSCQLTD